MAYPSPRSARSSATASPTASFTLPCFTRPRSAHSYVSPSSANTRQTPPVPERTVPCIRRRYVWRSFVPHGIPPASCWAVCELLANQLIEHPLHGGQRQLTDGVTSRLFRGAVRKVVRLEMTFDSLRAHASPAEEEKVRTERTPGDTCVVDDDLDAVRHAVRSLERRRPRVHGGVAANRIRVTTRMIGREEAAGHALSPAQHLFDDVAGHERDVCGTFGEPAHQIRIPLRAERHVHAHPVALTNELVLQIATHAVEHLKFIPVARDRVLRRKMLRFGNDALVMRRDAGIVAVRHERVHAANVVRIDVPLFRERNRGWLLVRPLA